MAQEYNFQFEFVTCKIDFVVLCHSHQPKCCVPYIALYLIDKWPHWLRAQTEKQRTIWGYKILFLDVLFPLSLEKVIFVDADQVVRADLKELMELDLKGRVYGYTPFCESRTEMDGFRFWKKGYWAQHLGNKPYHIRSATDLDAQLSFSVLTH